MGFPAAPETGATAPLRPTGLDFRITGAEDVGRGSPRERARANLAALRLLEVLDKDGRLANADEQQILAQYTGWGASELKPIVGEYDVTYSRDQWVKDARAELIEILGDEKFTQLAPSLRNAHYSYRDIPAAMWQAVQRLGFDGGVMAEPAVGAGHFLGLAPDQYRGGRNRWITVDLDPIAARLVKQLYQSAKVYAMPYQKAPIPDNYVDLFISNVPFGKGTISDPRFIGKREFLTRSIHNYFFGKALDQTKPGGLIAFVTSHFTMDAPTASVIRRYLADRAHFHGAIRLPSNAFAEAKTQVVTDIIFLQKLRPGETPRNHDAFVNASKVRLGGSDVFVSQWYQEHPEMVLGEASATGTMYGRKAGKGALLQELRETGEYTVELEDPAQLPALLTAAVQRLPEGVYQSHDQATEQATADLIDAAEGGKHGEFEVREKKVYQNEKGRLVELEVSPKVRLRIVAMVGIRDHLRSLITEMRAAGPDADFKVQQRTLKKLYDRFTAQFGPLNSVYNISRMKSDPEYLRVRSLERTQVVWTTTADGEKKRELQVTGLADIFTRRTIGADVVPTEAASATDAFAMSLGQRGGVDLPYMAHLTGRSEADLASELNGVAMFEDADHGWLPRDEYLSGDVVTRLDQVERRIEAGETKWAANRDALRAVQPQPLETADVDIQVGANWVPAKVWAQFAAAELGVADNTIRFTYTNSESLTRWDVTATGEAARASGNHRLAVADYGFLDLLQEAMNLGLPKVTYTDSDRRTHTDPERTVALQANVREIRSLFRQWWPKQEALAKKLTARYNAVYNREVRWKPDGSHLTFPGMAIINPDQPAANQLRPHQKNWVWRALRKGNTLAAHVVGSGKTWESVALAMEKRRLGLTHKNMIVVPNHMIPQWTRAILTLYPGAKLLSAKKGEASSKERGLLMSRIALGDWDIVLVTHSAFERLPLNPELYREYVEEQVAELKAAAAEAEVRGDHRTVNQIQARIDNMRERLDKRLKAWAKDQTITFEELGVDNLIVDEAHYFKNLFFSTQMQNVSGLNRSDSQRATDMFLKIRHVNRLTNEQGVHFLTGTPISNQIVEAYTMMRYLMPTQLERLGLANFDAWARQFAEVSPSTEMTADGNFKERSRLKDYFNAAELFTMFRQIADVQLQEDLNLDVPKVKGGGPILVVTKAHPRLDAYKQRLTARMKACREAGGQTEDGDNFLKITGDAKAAALDMRLVDPNAHDFPDSRLNRVADLVAKIYKDTTKDRGTQLVFLDTGVPKSPEPFMLAKKIVAEDAEGDEDEVEDVDESDGSEALSRLYDKDLYSDIKAKLVAKGVRADQIAFIHSAKSEAQRELLEDAVNDGRIRVLISSRFKAGVGTNVQQRVVAIHQVDVPWRPDHLEQSDGRGIRQGNILWEKDREHFRLQIYRYVTEGSFDGYIWGLLSMKLTFIKQLMKGELTVRQFTEIDTEIRSMEDAMYAASSPLQKELFGLMGESTRLQAQKSAWEERQQSLKADLGYLPHAITGAEERVAAYQALAENGQVWKDSEKPITLNDETYAIRTQRNEVDAAINALRVQMVAAAEEALDKKVEKAAREAQVWSAKDAFLKHHNVGKGQERDLDDATKAMLDAEWPKVRDEYIAKETKAGDLVRKMTGQSAESMRVVGHIEPGWTLTGRAVASRDHSTFKLILDTEGYNYHTSEWDRRVTSEGPVETPSDILTSLEYGRTRGVESHITRNQETVADLKARLASAQAAQGGTVWEKQAELDRVEARRKEILAELDTAVAESAAAGKEAEKISEDDVSKMTVRPADTTETKSTDVPLSPTEIVSRLETAFGDLPIKTGQFRQRALGVFKRHARVVRTRVANDLEVIAHELGHYVSQELGIKRGGKPYSPELEALGREQVGEGGDAADARLEGAAEYVRLYMLDPTGARTKAPIYTAAFEHALAQEPVLQKAVLEARTNIGGFLGADPIARGMARIDFHGNDPDPGGDFLSRMETAWVDNLAPIRHAVAGMGTPDQVTADAYQMGLLARGASMKADGFLRFGVKSRDGSSLSDPLEGALKPVAHQAREFSAYLAASRVPELAGRGIRAGMTVEEANAILAEFQSPEFDEARQAVYDFQDAVLEYATEAGALSTEQVTQIRALNQFYVPFQRVMDEVQGRLSGSGGGKIANRALPVKRIKGSGRDIINPLESIIRNTHTIVNMVETNRAMQALADQADRTEGSGRYLEKVPTPSMATRFDLSRVTPQVRAALEAAGVEDLPDNLSEALEGAVTVFTPYHLPTGHGGLVTVIRDGKRDWYAVNDQSLYDAITSIGPQHSDLLLNLLMRPARLLRAGATLTFSFAARNPIRDTFTAAVFSQYGFRLGYDTLKGLFEYLEQGDAYQQFLNSGGGNAALVSGDRNRIREEIRRMGQTKGKAFVASIVRNPVELLRAVSEATEVATRLGEFMRAVQKEGRTPEGYARAALAARKVTIDFARGGGTAREANRYVAFFNANVQGWVRLAETFGVLESGKGPTPGGGAGGVTPTAPGEPWRAKQAGGAAGRALACITLISVALWYLNHDDVEYRELPTWEKNTYWHIPVGRGKGHAWARIPKTFELGNLFGSYVEAALDFLSGKDRKIVDRVFPGGTQSAWSVVLGLTPTAIVPMFEAATNYDTFRKRAIVSPFDQTLDLELQGGRWTSEVAKHVGPLIGLAPAKFDHLVYGYTGGLGRGVVSALDVGIDALVGGGPSSPAGGLARAPLASAFYRETPRADAQSFQEFYETRDALNGALRSVDTYRSSDRSKADARLKALNQKYGGNARRMDSKIAFAEKGLKADGKQVNATFASVTLTPEQKRQQLNRIYERMLGRVRQALGKAKQ